MKTGEEVAEVIVVRMEEMMEAVTQELLQMYSEEKFRISIKDVKAGRLGK